ncbi:T9SS type A sorting domain-containing protein [Pseudoflavitalea rhizosphaerae]|uniref:T9SS type A sorting domain-containing protein n=1 Tax=Pseudoflavitalea rhizosphaerae TaxID=1884793 RepID=UPI000F8E342E|nr:T9SS type A sorting domain-containing protein [Pseudoflavitalea rhizosphaerae]
MKKCIPLVLLVCLFTNCLAQSFTPGNFVVVRIGSGIAPLEAGVAQPVYLDEYNSCGDLVRSIPMPVAVNGSNKRLTLPISTSDYTEGYISRSQDGSKLALAGYDADPGTTGVSATTSTAVKRVVAIIDQNGAVNTSTALSAFSSQVVRGAVTDGPNIWVSGGSGGIMYTTTGSTTHTQITTSTARCLMVINSQLYATSTAGAQRLTAVGAGLPTTTGQSMVNLPGTPTTGSPYQFFIVNAGSGTDVLYIADDNLLRKYSLSGGAWVSNGVIGTLGDKYRAVTGQVNGNGHVIIYAIRRNDNTKGSGGEVVSLTDSTGHNSSFAGLTPTLIVKSNENNVFRSIVMAPDPSAPGMAATAAEDAPWQMQLSPNAANNKVLVTFKTEQSNNAIILITNSAGQVMKKIESVSMKSGQTSVDVEGLVKGVYYLTLHSGNKKETKKLVKL